jgi:hypothetical protein
MIKVYKFYDYKYYNGIEKGQSTAVFTDKNSAEKYFAEYRKTSRYFKRGACIVETLINKNDLNALI